MPAAAAGDTLLATLRRAADGELPPRDGLHVVPAPGGPVEAVVGFPFHNLVATSLAADEVRGQIDADDPAGPLRATFLAWMAERLQTRPGSLDVVLACPEASALSAGGPLPAAMTRRDDLVDHPRVRRAMDYRTGVVVAADDEAQAVAIAGRGLSGRWEISFELAEHLRGHGHGAGLAALAASLAPPGEPVFAQTAPANVSSLRTLLAAGFTPIGAEVLFLAGRDHTP